MIARDRERKTLPLINTDDTDQHQVIWYDPLPIGIGSGIGIGSRLGHAWITPGTPKRHAWVTLGSNGTSGFVCNKS